MNQISIKIIFKLNVNNHNVELNLNHCKLWLKIKSIHASNWIWITANLNHWKLQNKSKSLQHYNLLWVTANFKTNLNHFIILIKFKPVPIRILLKSIQIFKVNSKECYLNWFWMLASFKSNSNPRKRQNKLESLCASKQLRL